MTDKLLKSLLYAEPENKVDDIIKNISFLSNPKSWVPYTILTRDGRGILISSDSQKEETTKSWESINFYFTCDINNGGRIKELEEKGYMNYISYDNVCFQNSLKGIKEESQVSKLNNNEKGLNEVYLDKFRRRAAAFASSVVLTLRENIPSYFESTDNDNE